MIYLSIACLTAAQFASARPVPRQQSELTPLQRQIKAQQERLSSADVEVRRDAVTKLGLMGRPESSRVAASALGDPSAIVRATAARAVLSLGPSEASALILPLMRDRDEFVRREAAYALGMTRSSAGVDALAAAVESDKKPSVRAAAAIALGQIGDRRATPALVGALSRRIPATGFFGRVLRRNVEEDEFVQRSAAVALGQIGSKDALEVLSQRLADERAPADVRREAARSLGLIGDPSAVPSLRAVLASKDPYLSSIAFEALRKINPSKATSPGR